MKKALVKTVGDSFICVLGLGLIFLLYTHSIVLTALLLVLGALVIVRHDSKKLVKVWVLVALFGTVCDIFGSYFGAWAYASPDFLGITFWSPVLWGLAGVYIAVLSAALEQN